jgi:hypothetical protein
MNNGATDNNKEANTMTKYYLTIARHFLSTSLLTAFGSTLSN